MSNHKKDEKPKDIADADAAYESDLIYFAIKATRTTGKEKLKYLRQLKNLSEAEYIYQRSKRRR